MGRMKLNSPQSLEAAGRVFRSYDNSWTKAREAGYRDSDGVLCDSGAGDRRLRGDESRRGHERVAARRVDALSSTAPS